eukprot:3261770-Rhodomonas_salina.1
MHVLGNHPSIFSVNCVGSSVSRGNRRPNSIPDGLSTASVLLPQYCFAVLPQSYFVVLPQYYCVVLKLPYHEGYDAARTGNAHPESKRKNHRCSAVCTEIVLKYL